MFGLGSWGQLKPGAGELRWVQRRQIAVSARRRQISRRHGSRLSAQPVSNRCRRREVRWQAKRSDAQGASW
jgi:hypothetical protein